MNDKLSDNELSWVALSVHQNCEKCNFVYTKTNQESQEWFPHGENEEIRFDYVNLDKDGKFSIAYTIRKNADKKCND